MIAVERVPPRKAGSCPLREQGTVCCRMRTHHSLCQANVIENTQAGGPREYSHCTWPWRRQDTDVSYLRGERRSSLKFVCPWLPRPCFSPLPRSNTSSSRVLCCNMRSFHLLSLLSSVFLLSCSHSQAQHLYRHEKPRVRHRYINNLSSMFDAKHKRDANVAFTYFNDGQ